MYAIQKDWVLNTTKEIVVAKMTSSAVSTNKAGGKSVADFVEEIYNKLVELVEKDDVTE